MPLPNLTRRGPRPLKRAPAPSVADHLRGERAEPLSEPQRAGYGALAELARRSAEEVAAFDARVQAAAAKQRADDDARYAAYKRRSGPPVRPLGGNGR